MPKLCDAISRCRLIFCIAIPCQKSCWSSFPRLARAMSYRFIRVLKQSSPEPLKDDACGNISGHVKGQDGSGDYRKWGASNKTHFIYDSLHWYWHWVYLINYLDPCHRRYVAWHHCSSQSSKVVFEITECTVKDATLYVQSYLKHHPHPMD